VSSLECKVCCTRRPPAPSAAPPSQSRRGYVSAPAPWGSHGGGQRIKEIKAQFLLAHSLLYAKREGPCYDWLAKEAPCFRSHAPRAQNIFFAFFVFGAGGRGGSLIGCGFQGKRLGLMVEYLPVLHERRGPLHAGGAEAAGEPD